LLVPRVRAFFTEAQNHEERAKSASGGLLPAKPPAVEPIPKSDRFRGGPTGLFTQQLPSGVLKSTQEFLKSLIFYFLSAFLI
jgi:hypothetical protein